MEVLKTPFNMTILGATCSGKTFHLLQLLEKDYMKHFDYIYLLCPTFSYNKSYQEWRYMNDPDLIVIECDQDDIEHFLKEVVYVAQGTNSCLVLDDCASSQAVKNRTSELIKLAFSARHYGLSVIVLTQQLTSLAKPWRENQAKLISFYNPNKIDMDTLFDEYLSYLSKVERVRIIHALKDKKYARLEILLRHLYTHRVVTP